MKFSERLDDREGWILQLIAPDEWNQREKYRARVGEIAAVELLVLALAVKEPFKESTQETYTAFTTNENGKWLPARTQME